MEKEDRHFELIGKYNQRDYISMCLLSRENKYGFGNNSHFKLTFLFSRKKLPFSYVDKFLLIKLELSCTTSFL